MHPFRAAVEAGDADAVVALLADDVVFRSPVVHTPYEGREAVGHLLRTVLTVFEDFEYTHDLGEDGPGHHALVFRARVGDRVLEGLDLLTTGEDGSITELVVMVRPLSGALALAEAMRERLGAPGA